MKHYIRFSDVFHTIITIHYIKSLTFASGQKFWVSGGDFHPYDEIVLKGNSTYSSGKEEEIVKS